MKDKVKDYINEEIWNIKQKLSKLHIYKHVCCDLAALKWSEKYNEQFFQEWAKILAKL